VLSRCWGCDRLGLCRGVLGAVVCLVQAAAGRLAVPVIWSQIAKRTVISRQWSGAEVASRVVGARLVHWWGAIVCLR